jgi:hypothetical protein
MFWNFLHEALGSRMVLSARLGTRVEYAITKAACDSCKELLAGRMEDMSGMRGSCGNLNSAFSCVIHKLNIELASNYSHVAELGSGSVPATEHSTLASISSGVGPRTKSSVRIDSLTVDGCHTTNLLSIVRRHFGS